MARTSLDPVPQRILLDLLRVEIERAAMGNARARRRVIALAEQNPRSWRSTYVRYNLGRRKYAWLDRVMTREPRPLPPAVSPRPTRRPLVGGPAEQ